MPEPVSPADTIRRNVAHSSTRILPDYRCPPECKACAIDNAVDEWLAVGERDKAELAELRGELAVAYGGPDRDGKQREWFSALDRAKAEAEDLREAGERDRRQIAQLTRGLKRIANGNVPQRGMLRPSFADAANFARAVLADEEDANGG